MFNAILHYNEEGEDEHINGPTHPPDWLLDFHWMDGFALLVSLLTTPFD